MTETLATTKPRRRAIPEIVQDTVHLCGKLREAAANGGYASYDELSKHIGRSCRSGGPAYHNLASARRIVERDDGLVFKPNHGKGLRLMTPEDAPAVLLTARKRAHRFATTGIRQAAIIIQDKPIADDLARSIHGQLNVLGTLAFCSSDKEADRLIANSNGMLLPVGRTLELFTK